MIRNLSVAIGACALGIGVAGAQPAPKLLTARELFYTAVEAPKPQPSVRPQAAPTRKNVGKAEARSPNSPAPAAKPRSPSVPEAGLVQLVAARTTAPAPTAGPPLGLKCTILKLSDGDMRPVPADTIFHAGDKIQLEIETNNPGYLYIISKGSSGTWKPMFP